MGRQIPSTPNIWELDPASLLQNDTAGVPIPTLFKEKEEAPLNMLEGG
jgi:hypothetical protein